MKFNHLKLFSVLVASLSLFTACEDEQADSIFARTDGGLEVILQDENGNPLENGTLTLTPIGTFSIIDRINTDANGIADFGNHPSGNYSIEVETADHSQYFNFSEQINIISGEQNSHIINLDDKSTDVSLRFSDRSSTSLSEIQFETLNVGLIPNNETFRRLNSDSAKLTLLSVEADFSGEVTFENQPTASYNLVIFNDNNEIASELTIGLNQFDDYFREINVTLADLVLMNKNRFEITDFESSNTTENPLPFRFLNMRTESSEIGSFTIQNDSVASENVPNFQFFGNGFNMSDIRLNGYLIDGWGESYTVNKDGSITLYFGSFNITKDNEFRRFYDNVSFVLR